MEDDKDILFVARRYRKGRFNERYGWRRLGITGTVSLWRRYRVAVSVAAAVALAASAALIYNIYDPAVTDVPPDGQSVSAGNDAIRIIDFENASLTDVIGAIEATYGVKVSGLPESPDEYRLSLHYEGTAFDLVETINDILGTELSVSEQ